MWTVAMRMSIRLAGVLNVAILARILTKDDFGLVAILFSIALTSSGFLDSMVRFALLRMTNVEEAHYRASFLLRIVGGALLALLFYFTAPLFEAFFKLDGFAFALRALAGIIFLDGFVNPKIISLQRNMEFHRDFIYEVSVGLVRIAIAIMVAFWARNYWAIIAGIAAGTSTAVLMSHLMCKTVIGRLSKEAMRDIWNIARLSIFETVAGDIFQRFDRFFLGKSSTLSNVGIYSVVMDFVVIPVTNIILPIGRVLLPSYHKLNREKSGKVTEAYTLGSSGMIAACIPVVVGMAMIADPMLRVLLSDEWADAVGIFQVAVSFAFFAGARSSTNQILVAENKFKTLVKLESVQLLVYIPLLIFATYEWGIIGAILAKTGVSAASFFVVVVLLLRERLIYKKEFFAQILRSSVAALAMAGALFHFIPIIEVSFKTSLSHLLLEIVLGIIVYGVCILGIWYVSGKPDSVETRVIDAISSRYLRRS